MSTNETALVSVKIVPNETSHPPGKLADAQVIFEADAGPLNGLELVAPDVGLPARGRPPAPPRGRLDSGRIEDKRFALDRAASRLLASVQ